MNHRREGRLQARGLKISKNTTTTGAEFLTIKGKRYKNRNGGTETELCGVGLELDANSQFSVCTHRPRNKGRCVCVCVLELSSDRLGNTTPQLTTGISRDYTLASKYRSPLKSTRLVEKWPIPRLCEGITK